MPQISAKKTVAEETESLLEKPIGAKILLIDDDPLVLKSLSNLLRSKKYEVSGCKSGGEAIRLLSENPSFNLIISDIRMPGLDGIQTIKRVREMEAHAGKGNTPVIVMTGFADVKAYADALELGIQAYLLKPIDALFLLNKISECLSRRAAASDDRLEGLDRGGNAKGVYQYASFFLSELDELKFSPKRIASAPSPEIVINGKKVVSFASNNVLGLGVEKDVLKRSIEYIEQYGATCGGSRLVSGNLTIQEEFERKIATFLGKEAVQLYMTGYMANEGILQALTQRTSLLKSAELKDKVVVLSDRENHVSIVNGCWLAEQVNGIAVRFYRHCNLAHLSKLLQKYEDYDRKIIITEGVYSMLGDTAPLDKIVNVAKRYGAFLIVDDAHAIGISGPNGRGTTEEYGVTADVDLIVGTLSKAFGAVGGFVASSETVINFLKVQASTYVFSSALPPSVIGSASAALNYIQSSDTLRKRLWANVEYLRSNLLKLGFRLLSTDSHIIPIFIGDEARSSSLSKRLLQEGIFVPEIRWPAVSKGNSLLRCMVTARHEKKHMDHFLTVLSELCNSKIPAELNERHY